MTAITDRPTDYWALWNSYERGIQPEQYVPQETKQPIESPKGIIGNFSREVEVTHPGVPLISTYFKVVPTAYTPSNEQDNKFIFERRVQAHFVPLFLLVS